MTNKQWGNHLHAKLEAFVEGDGEEEQEKPTIHVGI